MAVARAVARLVRDLIAYSVASRRFSLILVVAAIAVVALLVTTVTAVGPVAIYPFL